MNSKCERTHERTHERLRIRPFRYDVAAIATGYNIEDPAEFASRITALMSGSSGFSAPATAAEKVEEPKEEEAKEAKEDDDKPEEVTAEVVE